jgi:hypothetical protein
MSKTWWLIVYNIIQCNTWNTNKEDINMKIKSVAYSSHGSHTFQLDCATDWQMAVWLDNVISIMLCQVATQLSSRAWVDLVPDLIYI